MRQLAIAQATATWLMVVNAKCKPLFNEADSNLQICSLAANWVQLSCAVLLKGGDTSWAVHSLSTISNSLTLLFGLGLMVMAMGPWWAHWYGWWKSTCCFQSDNVRFDETNEAEVLLSYSSPNRDLATFGVPSSPDMELGVPLDKPPETPKVEEEDEEEKLAVDQELFNDYFERYDLDKSGTLNSSTELVQITVNLIFAMAQRGDIPPSANEDIEAVVSEVQQLPVSSDQVWTKAVFLTWFQEKVLTRCRFQFVGSSSPRYSASPRQSPSSPKHTMS